MTGMHISEVYPRKLEPCIFDQSQHDIFDVARQERDVCFFYS